MLKRAPSLTEQVKTHIKELIRGGAFPDGRIPSETELAEAMGVSRTTVRDALSRLEIEGTIVRKQGSGTFINKPMLQIHSRLEEVWSYEAMLEAHGFTPSTLVLDSAEVLSTSGRIEDGVTTDLALAEAERVLTVDKLFLENEAPVILTRNYIPMRHLTSTYSDDALALPVYDFLETHGPQRLAYYLTDIVPLAARGEVAGRLQLPAGTPLIKFDETGYNDDNEPILKAYSYFRDDLLRLRLLRRRV